MSSFSYEKLKNDVKDLNTHSECARFIHAIEFIDKYKNDIFIMDADCFIVDDLDSYSKKFLNFDIGVAFSKSLAPIFPWKRILAGDCYFSNTDKSIEFIGHAKDYILSNIDIESGWTLDQNALVYAFENVNDISMKNVFQLKRPFLHASISNYIERE